MGNQYDKAGYRLCSDTGLSSFGAIAKRMDGTIGLTRDGSWALGFDWLKAGYTNDMIDDAIWATLKTGQDTVVTLTRQAADGLESALTPVCPRCHTYCFGDCQA